MTWSMPGPVPVLYNEVALLVDSEGDVANDKTKVLWQIFFATVGVGMGRGNEKKKRIIVRIACFQNIHFSIHFRSSTK